MVWRVYYTIKDAAAELSRELNDTYTVEDLIHYGANGIAEFYLYDKAIKHFFITIAEELSEIIDYQLPNNDSVIGIAPIVTGSFIPLSIWNMVNLEATGQGKISSVDFLKEDDGGVLKAREGFIYQIIPPNVLKELKRLTVHANIRLTEFYGYAITFTKDDLYILTADLSDLKNKLKEKIASKSTKSVDDRTSLLNIISALKNTLLDKQVFANQNEIIEYLSNEFDDRGLSESNLKAKFAEANSHKKSN